MRKIVFLMLLSAGSLLLSSCDSGPKVIEREESENAPPTEPGGGFSFKEAEGQAGATASSPQPTRTIVVKEVLNTDRYSYLRATEGTEEFWVAISKRDIKVGGTYVFQGGLLKKNFFSQEFQRAFETLYLVSNLSEQGGGSESELDAGLAQMGAANLEVGKITWAAGAVKLSELFSNKSKYANKQILVTGKCIKVNPMIMNRNWIHLQDGTGEKLDLTVTTTENIPLGAVVTLKGTIALDKDFGAGYRYDIIMEGAVVQQ
jgi:hypothetical protein